MNDGDGFRSRNMEALYRAICIPRIMAIPFPFGAPLPLIHVEANIQQTQAEFEKW